MCVLAARRYHALLGPTHVSGFAGGLTSSVSAHPRRLLLLAAKDDVRRPAYSEPGNGDRQGRLPIAGRAAVQRETPAFLFGRKRLHNAKLLPPTLCGFGLFADLDLAAFSIFPSNPAAGRS